MACHGVPGRSPDRRGLGNRTGSPIERETVLKAHVTIEHLTKTFQGRNGDYTAVRDVNLEIGRGEFVTLIGHSGCGKSTVMNIIAGLEQPTSGQVLVEGVPVREPGPERGMVFQNYSLLPWLSVEANVYEAVDSVFRGKSRDWKREQVERCLRVVHLWDHRRKKPHEISGGMKQRTAIARAFAVHPRVLLLDEPFGALDALTRTSLQEELLSIWALDSATETVVMVTHDIDEATYLSDRIAVMTNGPGGTIGEIVEVPIPRPRDKRAMVHLGAYADLKDHLLYLLTVAFAEEAA
ncbi:MAG: ABC transporter ATP-binding protein [Chloroflexi bacterium]|nr:ABC transporter ATP-binding protein [Chloroflexota bacterium]